MTQPTRVAYSSVTPVAGGGARTTASFTWLTGDVLYAIGTTEDNGTTMTTPVAVGLTFSLVSDTNTGSNCRVYLWSATAASGSSGVIASTVSSINAGGLQVWQYRGGDGAGTPVVLVGQTAKTYNLTRAGTDSHVIGGWGDWNQVNDVAVTPSPSTDGTILVSTALAGRADFFGADWINQGATGTTAYGMANHTGTVKIAVILMEVKGTAGGGGSTQPPRSMHQFRMRRAA